MAGSDEVGVSHNEVPSKHAVLIGEKTEEINLTADGIVVDHGLHRALKQRHLQMIALGGVIGLVQTILLGRALCSYVALERAFGMEQAWASPTPDRYAPASLAGRSSLRFPGIT